MPYSDPLSNEIITRIELFGYFTQYVRVLEVRNLNWQSVFDVVFYCQKGLNFYCEQ